MRQRSHDSLRARDRGWAAHRAPLGSLAPPPLDVPALLRDLQARLEPPARARPYWSVWQGTRFLAAARDRQTALRRAALLAPPLTPTVHAVIRPRPAAARMGSQTD